MNRHNESNAAPVADLLRTMRERAGTLSRAEQQVAAAVLDAAWSKRERQSL